MKKLMIAIAMAALLPVSANAGPTTGDWEIVFSNMGGGLEVADGDWALGASIKAGYFFTNNHELGLTASLAAFDIAGANDETFGVGGFYRYNWQDGNQKSWWFAGVDLDIADAEEASDTLYLRPHFGHKWMLSEDVAFDLDAGVSVDVDESDNDPTIGLRMGLTIFF